MKNKLKTSVAVLFSAGLLLAVFVMRGAHRKPRARLAAAPHERAAVESAPDAVPEAAGKPPASGESSATAHRGAGTGRKAPQAAKVPEGITFAPGALSVERPELLPLVCAASNAVLSIDRILKAGDYRVNEFSRSVWLTSEDKGRSIVWTIFPHGTNNVVGSVEATAYQDAALTVKDPSRSFRMSFYPDSGELRDFSWSDSREVLFVYTNGPFSVDYARRITDKVSLEMRWDAQGNLVSSNVYDWALRGRVIGGSPPPGKTAYRFGPTSSVEAATESWRRKGE